MPAMTLIAVWVFPESIDAPQTTTTRTPGRSEEHTSELQSQSNLVCRLLLEKKNTTADPLLPVAARSIALRYRFGDRTAPAGDDVSLSAPHHTPSSILQLHPCCGFYALLRV